MATPHTAKDAQRFAEVFTPPQIMELLTALFDSLPAETRARLRWTPAEIEQRTLQLLDSPLDDALLLRAYQGVLRAGHEIYEGVFLKGGGLSLLAWLLRTAGKTGQLEVFLRQAFDQAAVELNHPQSPVIAPAVARDVLASVDALSAYGYEWCVFALSALAQAAFQSLHKGWRLWMPSLMSQLMSLDTDEDEDKNEGEGEDTDDEAAETFGALPPITRFCVAVGVSVAGVVALQLGAQAQRQPLALVRLVEEIERLLVLIPDVLAQTRADLDDDKDATPLRAQLDALSAAWEPLLEAHARLAQASDLVRTFKHRAALAVLDDASRAQDPSGVLERLYQHLSRGVSMMVYRPNMRHRSVPAVEAAMQEWSKTRSLWAAIGDEGLIDQDDDLKALKQRLQGREGTFTLMSMGRPADAPAKRLAQTRT